jgi:hypothetical protein
MSIWSGAGGAFGREGKDRRIEEKSFPVNEGRKFLKYEGDRSMRLREGD